MKMFEREGTPRVMGLPPGADFPAALVAGLLERMEGQPPEAMGRVHLIVNTRRMARRIQTLLATGGARLLPRLSLVTELGRDWTMSDLAPPAPPLRRRLELIQLISGLLDQRPEIAPRTALYDLADTLAKLMDEMEGEGVDPDVLAGLNVADQSGHWERILAFLDIVRHFTEGRGAPGTEARQRQVIMRLIARWQAAAPAHPVILAGSTGSRGTTQMLMRAVAALPQGAVVLPGYDFDMEARGWAALNDQMLSEDHPQYRFHALRKALDLDAVQPWTDGAASPSPARARLVSLALRPAPITDQWLEEGPQLPDISEAMQRVTLLEAPSQRIEALAIAMRLRAAAEAGQTAALITPDRGLTRRVAAALDRWGIIPDDSAGTPLHLTPPGRFLRHVAELGLGPLTAEALLTLLKHPLAHTGGQRGAHLRLTRELELHLRRHGPPYPTAESITAWAATQSDPMAAPWAGWIARHIAGQEAPGALPLDQRSAAHLRVAEAIADGCAPERVSELWQKEPGKKARAICDLLTAEANNGGEMTAQDYAALFAAILRGEQVRRAEAPHSGVLIWGTLEARVQGADMLILAGLNEGSWPEAQPADPWLNRALRAEAGLLLPERRIGLAAHDFQQAVLAGEVWITRSLRSDESETVVSRWLNRMQNLMEGLPGQGGPDALAAMRARGKTWLDRAAALEEVQPVLPAPRPAPCPPVDQRPNRLAVTDIKRLIRDPYAIYAKHVLRLRPLDPLMQVPDALLRGTILHEVLEEFIKASKADPSRLTAEALMSTAREILAREVPWAEARALWLARLGRVAERFIDDEITRRTLATPTEFEAKSKAMIADLGFTLTAKADRVDLDETGQLHVYDYKTGTPPSEKEQGIFDKQLLLEAAIAEQAGFGDLAPARVARATYIGLGGTPKNVPAPLDKEPAHKVWQGLRDLIAAYADPGKGYTARRAMQKKDEAGDYDQLARFGEWDASDDPAPRKVP